ncbi:MAG TPA: hypothetical protein VK698_34130 [Kofleriaceae bacterium]|nr:hypothetical protein [Kofleriaceae bacterium]
MTRAIIVVDAATVRPGRAGPATGSIWVSLGELSFPMEGWNDFVVVILAAWVGAMVRLLRGSTTRERVHFMEGPYFVDVLHPAEGPLRLRATGPPMRAERACVDVEASPLVESLLSGSDAVLGACRAAACWTSDAEELESLLPALRRLATQLTEQLPPQDEG